MKEWTCRVKVGRCSIEDKPRTERPISSTTPDVIAEVQEFVSIGPYLSIEEIALTLDISSGSVYTILHDLLEYRKISARWIPQILTKRKKEKKVSCSKKLK